MKRRTLLLGAGGVLAVLLIGGGVALSTTTDAVQPKPTASVTALDPAAQRYVDAVTAKDLDALVAAFAKDAVVVDVSREIRGHQAIRHWADTEVIGGRITVLGNTPKSGGTTMLIRFEPGGSGGFRANYSFDIADGLITKAVLGYA